MRGSDRSMGGIHGGDIYRNHVDLDFSVNVNPLGMTDKVETALHHAVALCSEYPDIEAEKLKKAVSGMLSVPEEYLLFGNGASELFMGLVHAVRPHKTVIPVPSFYGYEHAAKAAGGEIVYYPMKAEKQFSLGEDFFDVLTEGTDLLFLANPNNPTGRLMSRAYLEKMLRFCRERDILVVLDECFIEFCAGGKSMLSETQQHDNLVIVRAFTKIFSIPGVRLGYLASGNRKLLEKVKRQLPEWNLSVFAQAAGCACVEQTGYIAQTAGYVKAERKFLEDGLKRMGFPVFPGEANFLLFYSEMPLYERLLERGILIRDCGNFRGLSPGYYRIAVKTRKDNESLLKVIGELS